MRETGPPHTSYQVLALLRRGRELLLVRRGVGWALPGGPARDQQEVLPALLLHVYAQTGLELAAPPRQAAYAVQVVGPEGQEITLAFDLRDWSGEPSPTLPEVQEARFWPLAQALELLTPGAAAPVTEPLLAYLQGAEPPGATWCYTRPREGAPTLRVKLRPGTVG